MSLFILRCNAIGPDGATCEQVGPDGDTFETIESALESALADCADTFEIESPLESILSDAGMPDGYVVDVPHCTGPTYRVAIVRADGLSDAIVRDDEEARAFLEHDSGAVPCSRYGSDSSDIAPTVLLAARIFANETGEPTTFRGLDHLMGLAVNDHDDIASILADSASAADLETIGQDRDSVLEWIHGDKEEARLEALRAYLIESGDYSAEEVADEEIESQTWSDSTFDAFANEYRVLDDEEADAAAVDYTAETLWAFNASFLADYMPEGIDANEIEAIRGDRCEDANTALLALVRAGDSTLEEIARAYSSADGRGHALASYDGAENEIEHAGRTWYVYRVN